MICPIPAAILKRRPGVATHYRHLFGHGWGPCGDDPKRTCPAGWTALYEVKLKRPNRRHDVYWVHHDEHSGGERPFYDRWRVYNAFPSWMNLRVSDNPWIEITTPRQEWEASMSRAANDLAKLAAQRPATP